MRLLAFALTIVFVWTGPKSIPIGLKISRQFFMAWSLKLGLVPLR